MHRNWRIYSASDATLCVEFFSLVNCRHFRRLVAIAFSCFKEHLCRVCICLLCGFCMRVFEPVVPCSNLTDTSLLADGLSLHSGFFRSLGRTDRRINFPAADIQQEWYYLCLDKSIDSLSCRYATPRHATAVLHSCIGVLCKICW